MIHSICTNLTRTLKHNFSNYHLVLNSKVILNSFPQRTHNLHFEYQIQPRRNKYSKRKSEELDDDSDSENEIFGLDKNRDTDKDAKIVQTKVNSLRADVILKSTLNLSRNKIEAAFYQNRIRINEEKLHKKSETVRIGDEVDFIKDVSPSNPGFLIVARVILLSATEKGENYYVSLKRFKHLLIENYKDPWKPTGDNL